MLLISNRCMGAWGHSASCLIKTVCWLLTLRDERALVDDAPGPTAEDQRPPRILQKLRKVEFMCVFPTDTVYYTPKTTHSSGLISPIDTKTCLWEKPNTYLWRRSENRRGPGQAPAEQSVVTAAAGRHFLDVLHALWKNPSLSTSSVKSTGLYQCTQECEWRIRKISQN